MTFATLIVLLTDMTRTALLISREVSLATVKISGTGIADLADVCNEIIALDGQICDPVVPAHIKANLPVYEATVNELRQHLADLVTANLDAFGKAAQDILKNDIARHVRLATERKSR